MVYVFGDYKLDDRLYTLCRAGESLKLEPKVFEVLVYLIRHCDRFVSRNELLEKLWPGLVVSEAALTQCIAKARRVVHDDGEKQRVIKTQHGREYRFAAEVAESGDKPSAPFHKIETPTREVSAGDQPVGVARHGRPREGTRIGLPLPLQRFWQRGSLALVGLLFVFGLVTILRHSSSRSSFPAEVRRAAKNVTMPEGRSIDRDQRRLWFLSLNSPEASAYGLRGWDYYYRFTPEANVQARHMFERAVAVDPQYRGNGMVCRRFRCP
jgi:DNA-binding winged helix-turn-helix (wHTH) protein